MFLVTVKLHFHPHFFLWFPDSENNPYKSNDRMKLLLVENRTSVPEKDWQELLPKSQFSWLERKLAERII